MFRKSQGIFPLNVNLNGSNSETTSESGKDQATAPQEDKPDIISVSEEGVELRFRRKESIGVPRISNPYTPGLRKGETLPANLFVGPGLTLRGDIGSCDRLDVQGSVDIMARAQELYIAQSGKVVGTVEVDHAFIEGSFEGTLIVNGCLHINKTGSASGSISYREIDIEKGGRISGDIQTLAAPQAPTEIEQVANLNNAGSSPSDEPVPVASIATAEIADTGSCEASRESVLGQTVLPRVQESKSKQSAIN